MTTFDLRIRFTGVCAFVPDKPFDQQPSHVTVVLPDGEKKSLGVDNKGLNRHRAFVRFHLRDVVGMPTLPDQADGIWDLGHFPHPSQQTKLTLSVTGGPQQLTVKSMAALANIGTIVDHAYKIDRRTIGPNPPKTVLAQFIIDRGTLSTGSYQADWIFPKYLCDTNVFVNDMSNEVNLDFQKVTSATLTSTPLGGGAVGTLPLATQAGGRVDITVANLCDNNPLEWPVRSGTATADQDFRWFFELLRRKDQKRLRKVLDGLYLPHPWPAGDGNGQGMDCFPASF